MGGMRVIHRFATRETSRTVTVRGVSMRVLVVEQGLADSGGLRANIGLRRLWRDSGRAEVDVFLIRSGDQEVAAHRRIEPVTVGVREPRRLRHALPAVLTALRSAARRSDIVVSGSEVGAGLWLSYLTARLAGRPVAAIIHAAPVPAARAWVPRRLVPLNGWVLRHLDAAICVAADLADDMVALGLPAERITVVPNTVDVAAIKGRADEVRPADIPAGTVVALGRLVDQKGFDVLLRAIAEVRRTRPGTELVIMGEGAQQAELTALAEQLGLADAVHLVGRVANPHPVTAAATVFCQPSRYEGASLALLEAIALGVPVIASRCGSGAVDALDDGRFGDLVPVDDAPALSAAILTHLDEPNRLRVMALEGSENLAQHTPADAAARYLDALAAVTRTTRRWRPRTGRAIAA